MTGTSEVLSGTSVSISAVAQDAVAVELATPVAKPGGSPGQTEASSVLWRDPNCVGLDVGVWECSPGQFSSRRSGYTEICVIHSGVGLLCSEDGTTQDLGPGTVLVLPDGWSGTWTVTSHLRKTYVLLPTATQGTEHTLEEELS